MNSQKFNLYLESLGVRHSDLVARSIIEDSGFIEVYPGALTLHIEPEAGVDFGFWAETKKFEALHFTLKKYSPSAVEYLGALPEPYQSCTTRGKVREIFGTPFENREPFRMPDPFGQTGGWDAYDVEGHINVGVTFKYNVGLEVSCVVFFLKNTGHY
ncbi:DUF6392 family protein [Pseudomonas sp. BBP2017]|uniref:DUF6392 family protein n=1 Tax=Pseudomonas sp. BBP2017 TaxID=2109731 RepID=UPI0011B2619F|nr:DUF6392 family protein [Pseudomonas sp. BBP2017]